MSAPIRNYYEYDRTASIICPGCGCSGVCSENEDYFSEVMDIRCGSCDRMLLIVPFPTHAETRKAASEGNDAAIGNLDYVEDREAFFARAEEHSLTSASDLPDLMGDDLIIEWDFDDREKAEKKDSWTVLRHERQEIWREVAFYEGIKRFEEVLWILREKYGSRMTELRPTQASITYLCGDDLRASSRIDSLNAELADMRETQGDGFFVEVEDADGQPDDPKRQEEELRASIAELGSIDCSWCGWIGEATEARVNGSGDQREVSCLECRRPLFRLTMSDS